MPSDDLILNVRQIAGYTPTANAPPSASLLMQTAGLGSAYASISPADLVGTALSTGGSMAIAGPLSVQSLQGGSAQFSNGMFGMLSAQKACIVDFAATYGTLAGVPIATVNNLSDLDAGIRAASVWSFNGRVGDVRLWIDDIRCAGGAPIYSPRFEGSPRACTPPPTSNSSRLATTAFVATAIGGITGDFAPIDSPNFTGLPTAPTPPQGSADGQLATTAFVANAVADSTTGVASFNGRTGIVALVGGDITAAGGALLASPVFTGTPSAPTQPTTDNSTRLATTAFVQAFAAPLASPAFTGIPTGPTAAPSTSTTQLATTAFVTAAIAAGMTGVVTTFNGRAGAVNLIGNDVSAAGGALLVSPAFTGTPTAPTAAPSTSNTQLATCAFVMAAVATGGGVLTFNGRAGAVTLTAPDVSAVGGALLASPSFTGFPVAPTAGPGTNTTQLATCAFVMAAVAAATAGVASFNGRTGAVSLIATDVTAVLPASTVTPGMNGVASPGTLAAWARGDHVHPVDTSRYAATNPSNFQTAAQVTASLAAYLPLSGGVMTGGITVPAVAGGGLILDGAAGSTRSIVASTNGVLRWVLQLGNNTAETGSNAGSNVAIWACNDAGALLGAQSALSIVRASQTVTLGGGLLAIAPGSLNPNPGVSLLASGGAAQVQIYFDATSSWFICNYGSVWHRLNPSGTFQVALAGSAQPGGGPWVAPSDDRIKTVTGEFDQGLEAVLALRPVTYVYNGNDTPSADVNAQIGRDPKLPKLNVKQAPFPGSDLYQVAKDRTTFVGFVAQELEAIAPSMVTKVAGFVDGQPVSDLRQVNTNNLVYMLINAVKALAAKVEALEAT
ncbi:MAG TPA: hypothetical protein VG057_07605 [Solirubrobacteraceae bacterium]|jgi:hypothetical protein|nr:hypothetical protein [Solirubrobacteraceae bacterium]